MSLVFVHLSDIHFGQEKGGHLTINDDVKEQLVLDAHSVVSGIPGSKADGVIISGDIAYAGKKVEYDRAGQWLDRLTASVGCERTAVQVVPGNHDIDLSRIGSGAQLIIDDIAKNGDDALNTYLGEDGDRELLYNRFSDYRTFAQAYNCPLDGDGTIAIHPIYEIAENKFLKFHGINTALICSKNKKEMGALLLGQRQRVIPQTPGVEIIIIAHHPMHWLQDSEDALRYIKNRARVFISGHEHTPSHSYEVVNDNSDLLSLASGAAAPPAITEKYNYCYNVLKFSWDDLENKLRVEVLPRMWNNEKKRFEADSEHFHPDKCIFNLRCPNYKNDFVGTKEPKSINKNIVHSAENDLISKREVTDKGKDEMRDQLEQLLLLKFFRELSSKERLSILVRMSALPDDLTQSITHSTESFALKRIFSTGRLEELQEMINETLTPKTQ